MWRAIVKLAALTLVATVGLVGAGPGESLTRAAGSTLEAPQLGVSEQLAPVAGSVTVRTPASTAFAPLSAPLDVPDGTEVDASRGRVQITVATLTPGVTATALAYQGRFVLHQDATAPAETHLTLSAPLTGCATSHRRKGRAGASVARRRKGIASRRLYVSDNGGRWGASGRYVSTIAEGTRWLTSDECRRSRVQVAEGVVAVRDLIHNTTVTVTAGHEYVAAQPPEERPGFVPPLGQVLSGETGVSPGAFESQTHKHISVFGYFGIWGGGVRGLLNLAHGDRTRLLLHLSTDVGYGGGASEVISPRAIAAGQGDNVLERLGSELAGSKDPVYVALLPEMNQANNAYSAFNPNGSSRGASNSTAAFRQAWRRAVLIVRGGPVARIDRRLRKLHMPSLRTSEAELPTPKVSFMWAPQTAGTPDTPANSAAAYYPGAAYVDVVGTDFYSAFPNFAGLSRLYAAYPTKPFGFNEWAMWRNGDPGFVRQLFAFVHSHKRVAIMVYNEGLFSNGPFRLTRFPAAAAELRRQLRSRSILEFPPE